MTKIFFPPLSNRLCEDIQTKNQWLLKYFNFRRYHENPASFVQEAKSFQASLGKNNSVLADRFRGAMLGLAIGDAFGVTLEFQPRPVNEDHREMIGKGPFGLKKGQWTDDTSMALCMAYSLLDKKMLDPSDHMQLYIKWWKQGLFSSTGQCFDIGNTVANALTKFEQTGVSFAGSTDERSAGNGSLMRLAPVILFYASSCHDAIPMAAESSKTTHGNIEAIDACRYFAGLLLGALYGDPKEKILGNMYAPEVGYWESDPLCPSISSIAQGSYKQKSRDQIKSTGYVIHTLEAVLWAFHNSDSFESGLIKAVNLGGDSDTIGAIYGQLAGAYYGELAIPINWIMDITDSHCFYYIADEFVSYYAGNPVKNSELRDPLQLV